MNNTCVLTLPRNKPSKTFVGRGGEYLLPAFIAWLFEECGELFRLPVCRDLCLVKVLCVTPSYLCNF